MFRALLCSSSGGLNVLVQHLLSSHWKQVSGRSQIILIHLLNSSTCFEHYVLIIRRSKLYYTASGIVTLCKWHKILFYNKFITFLYMFRALCAHHQEDNCTIQHLVSSQSVSGTKSCFIISLLHSSTCFEHYVLIIRMTIVLVQHLVTSDSVGGRPVHRLREDFSQSVRRTGIYRRDDTRCCTNTIVLLMMST